MADWLTEWDQHGQKKKLVKEGSELYVDFYKAISIV